MRIELSRCVVRSWSEDDATDLAPHADCREVWINLRDGFPHPYTVADALSFIRSSRALPVETNFAIAVDGRACGGIGLRLGEDVERVSAEVGYWLGRAYWGRGVATEALIALRDYAIEAFSLTRIWAVPYEWNVASTRVLEKAGFKLEGRLRRSAIKDGRVIDQFLYAFVAPQASR